MTSLLCGLAAACCWAGVNVIASQVTRDRAPCEFAFWLNMLGFVLCAPVALALLPAAHVSLRTVLVLALAGVMAAATTRLVGIALARGRLSIVGPLLSLEGAVAAAMVIAVGGAMSRSTVVGGLLAVAGSVAVGLAAARKGHLEGSALAVMAAACGGVSLWAFARQPLAPVLAFAIMRAFGVVALAPLVVDWGRPRNLRWLSAIAVLDVGANLIFLVGARGGSLPVTAVLASQFGTLTAIGGVWRWREALNAAQVAGLVVLGVGVAIIATASG
jgi:drug/metabolite transporter (DMT)-like permease